MTNTEYNKLEIDYINHTLNVCKEVEKSIVEGKISGEDIQSYSRDNIKRISDCILKLKAMQENMEDFIPAQ
jgi:hypothetical protein